MDPILIVGLGNPGKQYKNTPHNAGALALDEFKKLLKERDISCKENGFKQVNAEEAQFVGRAIVLAKLQTFMNESGTGIRQLLDHYHPSSLAALWIVHDDIDLPLGTVRLSRSGRSGGHRGIADIIDKVGTEEFTRFRIGIRPEGMPEKRPPELMQEFVTAPLTEKDKEDLTSSARIWAQALLRALEEEATSQPEPETEENPE